MARKNRKKTPTLKDELLAHGNRFSFFQALRLLNLFCQLEKKKPDIQVRPDLSLGFPASDIAHIAERPDKKGYVLTSTFLGLYGVSSPLPTFFTEDLFNDAREGSEAARDFIDIIHRRIYDLFFECWEKYRLFIQISEKKSEVSLGMLYALSGLSPREADYSHLRYSGLLGPRPRSALGLETILSDVLGGVPVEVISCVPKQIQISPDQRLQLGSEKNALGVNSLIGKELIDYQSKFRVKIGPIRQERFRSVLYGGEEHEKMTQLINRYLVDPLEYDFEVILEEGEAKQACLGGPDWSRLGLDTVLYTGKLRGNLTVEFPSAN